MFFLLIALLLLLFLLLLFVFIFPLEQIRLLFLFAFSLSILYLFNLEKVKFSFVVEKKKRWNFLLQIDQLLAFMNVFSVIFFVFLYDELFFISCKYIKSKMVCPKSGKCRYSHKIIAKFANIACQTCRHSLNPPTFICQIYFQFDKVNSDFPKMKQIKRYSRDLEQMAIPYLFHCGFVT